MTREEILDTAKEIVCNDRNKQYGEPEDNFNVIADFWESYLYATTGTRVEITANDVAMMMCLFKIARYATSSGNAGDDTFIDLAGYAACGGEIAGR